MQDLICISHLRWDFVWQRPQHLLSRLAQQYRILFVEEPVTNPEAAEPYLETFRGRTHAPGSLTVARLMQPSEGHYWIGHNDARTQAVYESVLADYLEKEDYTDPILWLYTPMALPFVDTIQPKLLIYDVMDELSAFKGAPAELNELGRVLLQQADLVFTGGASLYRSRLPYNENTHLFPSGVEIDHFARADKEEFERPADLADVPHPIIGYFGVVDERMDLPLLTYLARAHPEWSIVLLGPVIKIEPADLPQAPNLHYLGMKDYNDLPAYLAHFDVAMVPFAMNESTRFLSPTKTLEYLAAHKPVVSTPIPDIIELYGDYVSIGHTPVEFAQAVEKALAEQPDVREARRRAEKHLLEEHTWDNIAGQMNEIIRSALSSREDSRSRLPANTLV